jgi:hypothetical protein
VKIHEVIAGLQWRRRGLARKLDQDIPEAYRNTCEREDKTLEYAIECMRTVDERTFSAVRTLMKAKLRVERSRESEVL